MWRDFRLPMSASAVVIKMPDWKINFCSKFAVKTLLLLLLMLTLEV